jgi:hypothetical protein
MPASQTEAWTVRTLRTGTGVSASKGVPDAGSPAVLRRRAFPLKEIAETGRGRLSVIDVASIARRRRLANSLDKPMCWPRRRSSWGSRLC